MKPTSADKTVKLWERSDKKLEKMFQRFVSDISQNNYDPTQITERITFIHIHFRYRLRMLMRQYHVVSLFQKEVKTLT